MPAESLMIISYDLKSFNLFSIKFLILLKLHLSSKLMLGLKYSSKNLFLKLTILIFMLPF